ncbi:Trypanosomal VSG domain containing protein [Trypanosoma brucei equiperdum]|uniref:Trypanosomal VSG domain containing protein n=1 Tax=Trypanosoma brucei equiperdum TaxID=630700 RepID=A0A3L6LEI7_9TRYP|nr:Trypanosomal VSG domain containing protein [Trypanosoma brucei equiperdum]
MCVSYKDQLKKGGTGIRWVNELALEADTLKTAETAKLEARAVAAELTALSRGAWKLYAEASNDNSAIERNSEATTQKQPQQQEEAKKIAMPQKATKKPVKS